MLDHEQGIHTFTVERRPTTVELGDDLIFTATSVVKNDSNSRAYKGILSATGQQPRNVVCKLRISTDTAVFARYDRRLRHEAHIYGDNLQDMQGHYVPRFYGLCTGSVASKPAICLLVEDCGVSVPYYSDLSFPWRYVYASFALDFKNEPPTGES